MPTHVFKKRAIFSAHAKELAKNPEVKNLLESSLRDWDLVDWEDALLFEYFPVVENLEESDIMRADELIKTFRGKQPGLQSIEPDELSDLAFTEEIEKQAFRNRLLHTIFLMVHYGYTPEHSVLLTRLRKRLEPIIFGEVAGLSEEAMFLVVISYVVLLANFFTYFPEETVIEAFAYDIFPVGLRLGIDWENIVYDYVQSWYDFKHRQTFVLDLATSIAESSAKFGRDTSDEQKDVKYWIDNFRIYTHNEFGGAALVNFLADKDYVGKLDASEVETLGDLLRFYSRLINGTMSAEGGDVAAIDKRLADWKKQGITETSIYTIFELNGTRYTPLEIKEMIDTEFSTDKNGDYEEPEKVTARLEEMARKYHNPKFAELYYFDESSGKFVWQI